MFYKPKTDPVELKDEGKVIGIAYTSDDRTKIIVEFNDVVEQGYKHKGHFFMSARALYSNPSG